MTTLESIDVGYSLFTDNGFDALTAIPNLKSIAVGGNKLTDVGLTAVRRMPNLVALWSRLRRCASYKH